MKIDYYAYHSGMSGWNAGGKLLLAAGTLCLTIVLDKPAVSLFVLLTMSLLTLVKGRIPGKVYLHFLSIPLAFVIVSGAAIAVEFGKSPLGDWNLRVFFFYLCLYRGSILLAGAVSLKAMAGISALYMLSLSTPVNQLVLVLQKLHLPSLLVELMNLIYRYIFILIDAADQMQTAAKARFGYGTFRQSIRSFALVAGNLFLVSLKKAGTYYDALLSRGYEGRLEFLTEETAPTAGQMVFTGAYLLAVLLLGLAV